MNSVAQPRRGLISLERFHAPNTPSITIAASSFMVPPNADAREPTLRSMRKLWALVPTIEAAPADRFQIAFTLVAPRHCGEPIYIGSGLTLDELTRTLASKLARLEREVGGRVPHHATEPAPVSSFLDGVDVVEALAPRRSTMDRVMSALDSILHPGDVAAAQAQQARNEALVWNEFTANGRQARG